MTILITGGAGFIGSHLADQLLTMDCTVHVLDNFSHTYNPVYKRQNVAPNLVKHTYHLHQGDVCSTETLEKLFRQHQFDIVVHLAALAGVQASFQQPASYTRVNVEGTSNVLEAMRKSGVKKLIYGSSSSVYGESGSFPLREEYPDLVPISPYAMTKYQGESLCRLYHQQFGIDTTCLRFFTVYGPRQRPDMAISQFLTALLTNRPLTIYGEGSSRDYTYVSDIVQGICKAILLIDGFEIYNIGSGIHVSVQQLIDTLEAVTGRQASIVREPSRAGDVKHTLADLTKAYRRLGYQPTVSLQEGISKMVDSFTI